MAALVCPKCWTYFGGQQRNCSECGGSLIVAERVGVYGGGRLDFAAETTPGLFAVIEFLNILTFLRAALALNGLLLVALLHTAVGDHSVGQGFFGPLADQIQLRSAQMRYVYVAWGVLMAAMLVLVRFKSARLVAAMAYGVATCLVVFFAATNGTEPLGFLSLVSMGLVLTLIGFSLRTSK